MIPDGQVKNPKFAFYHHVLILNEILMFRLNHTLLVRVSIEKPQIQFYKCNNHKSLNAPSFILPPPSEAWTIKFNIMAPTKIGCHSAVLLEGDYVREGSMGRLLSSSGSKIPLGLLKTMCTIQVLIHKVKVCQKLNPLN